MQPAVRLLRVENARARLLGVAHGKPEHRSAVLLHVVQALLNRLERRRHLAAAGRHAQRVAAAAVHVVLEVDDADLGIVAGLDDGRAGAITEDHARGAIGVVDDARHDVGADHQRVLARAGGHHLRRRRQRIGESRARGEQVVAPGARRANLVLHQARRARKQHVGRRRADDDEVDVVGREPGAFDRLLGGFGGQVGRRDARLDDVPLTNASALQDPFVAGLDHLFEIGVGEHFRRHIGGETGDARTAQGARRSVYHRRESLPGAVSPKYS